MQRSRQTTLQERRILVLVLLCLVVAWLVPGGESFATMGRTIGSPAESSSSSSTARNMAQESSRRSVLAVLVGTTTTAFTTTTPLPGWAAEDNNNNKIQELRTLLLEAQTQLDLVPGMIRNEKWDAVRTTLMEAPLRDCWSKTTPILKGYADAIGDTPDGDELAALEGREDLLQHLRFLDMAVYNNVFNPISTEGTTGASKALIDSYYNDPTREYEASKKALEDLLRLSK